jgi:hypothetical protein
MLKPGACSQVIEKKIFLSNILLRMSIISLKFIFASFSSGYVICIVCNFSSKKVKTFAAPEVAETCSVFLIDTILRQIRKQTMCSLKERFLERKNGICLIAFATQQL